MDLQDQLAAMAARIPKQTALLQTEAATSAALILPFIRALGYDPFEPAEVVPEYTADVGTKKGEKVDFAIVREGGPILLFEVKCWNVDLSSVHASQLYRYFSVTRARFGILTNGIVYRFFTDLDEPNKMDEKPFLEFSMLDLKEPIVEALKGFTKARFQVDTLISAATELKYTNGIKRALASELSSPSDEFVKYFARQVYTGRMTETMRLQFADIVKRAAHQLINERINERLQSAIAREEKNEAVQVASAPVVAPAPDVARLSEGVVAVDGEIVTTEEEVEAHRIIRAIVAEQVNAERVVMRDGKSYCAILFDDNNRRPIARLYFGAAKKSVMFFDRLKHEERIAIESLNDLYKHAERLRDVVRAYLDMKSA